ncbi:hypothetical protein LC087_11735 [Bacillus carboniphilus]|uniref:Uncharacterized protein n=1 Tax=Bacillus carboniphilus TaxID=86663 RepID=A0ABY9JQ79_9BACI|nr:hypothetical protein [Bacillus carboniphilus]WLR41556.1 hypothetical protein LC087_11735 [Bacillus carboniphilus]
MCDKEDIQMATETIFQRHTLDEEDVNKIISSPRTIIKETNVFNDVKLTQSERIANAERILKSRKCK